MAMALVDRSLRAKEFGEKIQGPAQEEEFVLYHSDNVEAQGFVQHLKLPHYIDFQAELNLVRKMRAEYTATQIEMPNLSESKKAKVTDLSSHETLPEDDEVIPKEDRTQIKKPPEPHSPLQPV